MRGKKTLIGLSLILAVLFLGIGYATISNVSLNISGTTSATASDENFTVRFDKSITPTTSNATAEITGDRTATIAVTELTTKGDIATATYTVINESTDLSAGLSANVTSNTNSDFFAVTYNFGTTNETTTTLEAGTTTTITVTVELTTTPATDQEGRIAVQLTAKPLQEGETYDENESSGSTTEGSASVRTSLAAVTNANIGDYIDLGNNIVGTDATTDDWRILYVEGDTVYAILADYLPNSTGYAEGAGLTTHGKFLACYRDGSTGSYTKASTFISILSTSSYWISLANGISGASVLGAPTAQLLVNSYNALNGTNIKVQYGSQLDSSTVCYNLYVPRTSYFYETVGTTSYTCGGYWLATHYTQLKLLAMEYSGSLGGTSHNAFGSALRPIVVLPNSLSAIVSENVWTVE